MRIIDVSVPTQASARRYGHEQVTIGYAGRSEGAQELAGACPGLKQSNSPKAEDAGMRISIPIYGRAGCTRSRS
jgi:hypothetical protein